MSDFVTLTCPTCGSKLHITSDISRFACLNCGNEHLVRRGNGIVSVDPIIRDIQEIRTSVDKTSSELAISRLRNEISLLESRHSTISSTNTEESKKAISLIIGGIFYIVLYLIFEALMPKGLFAAICIAIPLLMIIVGFAMFIQISKNNEQSKIDDIRIEINRKIEELKEHEKIVS